MVENHQSARLGPIAAPLVLLLIVCGAFWKITLVPEEYTWLDSPDLANIIMPWLQFESNELHRGHLPLWDPHEGGGQPLLGQTQPGLVNPVNWLLFAVPLAHGRITIASLNAYFILIHYLAALFCYWLCRDLGRSVVASIFGGCAFALGGWIGYTDWPQMLSGGIWAPLIFLFLFRALRADALVIRNAALSGAFLGLAFLSGHHQIPMFTSLAAGACWLYCLSLDWRSPRRWSALAMFGIMVVLVGAVQILPAGDYGRHAVRWAGANHPLGWTNVVPYRVLDQYSLPPAALLSVVIRDLSENTTAYVGCVVLLMAAAGVVVAWRETPPRLLAMIATGGILLAMGAETVFHGMLYALIPEFDKARTIGFAVFLFGFGAAVLAAYGLDRFPEASPQIRGILVRAAFLSGAVFMIAPWVLFQTNLSKTQDYNLIIFYGLAALMTSAVLAACSAGKLRQPALPLLAFSLIELGTSVGYGYQRRNRPVSLLTKLTEHEEIAAWLKHQPGPVRAAIDSTDIPYNFCDWYGIDTMDVQLTSLTTNMEAVRSYYWTRMLLGTNYYLARKPLRPDQIELFTDRRGVKIYGNPQAFPRAWVVHKAVLTGIHGMGPALENAGPQLLNTAIFVANPPSLENCAGDAIHLLRRTPDSLEFEANMNCRGLAVIGETYDPGWRATMDGRAAPILEVDGIARGVVLQAGHHNVAMTYRPASVLVGAILTCIGLFAFAAFAFRRHHLSLNS